MAFPTEPEWGTEWTGASPGDREHDSPSLADKVLAVDHALTDAGIPHAIGGAIAFAYYGAPRATIDIDVNVFASVGHLPEVAAALRPLGIDPEHDERELIEGDEARLFWDRNPVHLFFSADALHEAMPAAVREVPFADETIPIVSPEHLVVRKAMLDRPKDWLDIEAILAAETPLDRAEIGTWLRRLTGREDPRLAKLDAMVVRLGSRRLR
jgi:hypothetical protein